jgi:GT2 family glycosyltransferase
VLLSFSNRSWPIIGGNLGACKDGRRLALLSSDGACPSRQHSYNVSPRDEPCPWTMKTVTRRWFERFSPQSKTLRFGLPKRDFEAVLASGVFDADFYVRTNGDVAASGLNPLKHYLEHGRFEMRKASAFFDPAAYLEANPDVARSGIEPFLHYVLIGRAAERSHLESFCSKIQLDMDRIDKLQRLEFFLKDLNAAAEDADFFVKAEKIEVSGLFDREFYLTHVPSLDQLCDPLFHYLIWGYRRYLDPSRKFSGAEYHLVNPDVYDAGLNPLLHYVVNGLAEGRSANLAERAEWYSRIHTIPVDVKPAQEHAFLERLRGTAYLSRYGFSLEKSSSLRYAMQAIDELAIRKPGFISDHELPEVSIIIPCYGQLQLLLNCLDSLAAQKSVYRAEIIVVDDDSPPETQLSIMASVPWVRYLKVPVNGGFIASCNYGADRARGQYLVFLNSDTRVVQNWLDELISFFKQNPKIGLVGSKLLNADGTLQEAGGIIWRDGSGANYGRGNYPWRPEYCFARQVDYCSGASIAVSSDAWKGVGGFDAFYTPAYYEDVELAFQLRHSGYQTWLQPLSLVIHYEGGSHGRDLTSGIKAYQTLNRTRFYQRWRELLRRRGPPGHYVPSEINRVAKQRVLVLDTQTPTPDRDAGSVVAFELIKLFVHCGWQASFAPRNFAFIGDYSQALQRMGVEVLVEPNIVSVDDVLKNRDAYDLIAAFRVESLWDCYERFRDAYPTARIIFFDVDLVHVRMQRKAELLADRQLRIEAEVWQDRELDLFANVDCSVVVTEAERQIVQSALPVDNIVVYPYTVQARRSKPSYYERSHLCFIGSYGHDPNVDAVMFFIKEVWPLVRPRLPAGAKFFVVGAYPPDEITRLASDDIVITGHVPKLDDILDSCRLSVAPLRYGAGIKGKLISSLAEGLPAVASPIAVEGMGLQHDKDVLVAENAEHFAAQILRLYNDFELWRRLQENGYDFVEANFSWQTGVKTLEHIIDTADRTWIARRRAARAKRLAKRSDENRDVSQ